MREAHVDFTAVKDVLPSVFAIDELATELSSATLPQALRNGDRFTAFSIHAFQTDSATRSRNAPPSRPIMQVCNGEWFWDMIS